MGKHKKYAVKLAVFLILLAVSLGAVNRLLIPKYYYNSDWPTTSTYLDFYNLDKNSVDVLFLGSSHCAAAFSPVELYREYGIRSYNLGCEQQNLLVSYYWLKEALRFQKPEYVFLDTFMLFPYNEEEALNTAGEDTGKAVDVMKWSPVKLEAIYNICRLDPEQKLSAYLFPNERFHTRWKGLSEGDFTLRTMAAQETLMGFRPLDFNVDIQGYETFGKCKEEEKEYAETVAVMEVYLDKILQLCEEKNIRLVLVKTPTMFYSREAYNTVCSYAAEHGIEYLDFNEESLYAAAGLDFSYDSCDTDHVSVSGAKKISDYLGEWLKVEGLAGREDAQWEKRVLFEEHCRRDLNLKGITNYDQYLQELEDENYAVFIVALGENENDYTVTDGGKLVAEKSGREVLAGQGTVRKGLTWYSIEPDSITVDGSRYPLSQGGINILIYCKEKRQVIDKVYFTFHDGKAECIR